MMQDEAYKRAKEAFVADLHGTSAYEVLLVFSIMPGTLWLYSELMLLLEVVGVRPIGAGNFQLLVTMLVEFLVLVVPTMVAFTLAEYALPLLVSVYAMALMLNQLSWKHAREYMHKHCRKEKMNQLLGKQVPMLTWLRAQIMISTCFAILAVDFTVFPRRFAKTETFGFSVMDIGVGVFIASSAIVSLYARLAHPSAKMVKRTVESEQKSWSDRCYAFLRPIVLVLVFGVARFLTVKGVNYQEHVSEYGVHWNFYFTLAGVYLVYSALQCLGKWATHPITATVILLGYQLYLSHFGGEEFILEAPRDSLFSQNREGILSLAGYTALYMLAVSAGRLVFGYMDSNGAKAMRNMRWLTLTVGGLTLICVVATFVSSRTVARASRRMMNLTYVLWVMAQSLCFLTLYCAIHVLCLLPRTPVLFEGVSRNQLFVFVLANLATGIVNLSMRTIEASPLVASGVLLVYMALVSVLATLLQHYNLSIKL